jgi:hypothetical protein
MAASSPAMTGMAANAAGASGEIGDGFISVLAGS